MRLSMFTANSTIAILLSLILQVPGINAMMQFADITVVQAEYEELLSERQQKLQALDQLESEYRQLVERIDQLKRRGHEGLAQRRELENLLRQARSLSDRLESLQTSVRGIDGRMDAQRARIVAEIDFETRQLERSLAQVRANERRDVLQEINQLRNVRARYNQPLPVVPDSTDLVATLRVLEKVDLDRPEQLLAAADELLDTEDQLRKRLDAIDSRLRELNRSRQLMRRAQNFSRQERFFDETDRNRVIARYQQDRSGPSEPAANPSPGDSDGAEVDEGLAAPHFEAEPSVDDFDSVAAPPQAGHRGDIEDVTSSNPPTLQPPSQDPFESSSSSRVVIRSSDDPQRAMGSGVGESELEREIRMLEDEQDQLRRQARELRNRADQLKGRAQELD